VPKTALSVVLALLLAGCASHTNAPDEASMPAQTDYETRRNLVYTPSEWPEALQADVYLPKDRENASPAVLLVHGGGWQRRSRDDMNDIAEHLAGHGFVVMNIDYRFAPDYTFPAQLHDLQQAMHWLHDNAADLDVDPDRINGFGYSSGAHLVSLMALVASNGGTLANELSEPYGGKHTRTRSVVAGGLPSDLREFGSGRLIREFLGGDMEAIPGVYEAASPAAHVSDQAPPFFLFHGTLDALVPTSQATSFQQHLESVGVDNELYLMRLRGHILAFALRGAAVDRATEFLARQNDHQ